MRTEVKRSLLVWPAAASVTITAMSWFSIGKPVASFRSAKTVASVLDAVLSRNLKDKPPGDIELLARPEHGARALRLPERVESVFATPASAVQAPVRDERKELAGLELLMPGNVETTDPEPADDSADGDTAAVVDPMVNDQIIALNQAIDADLLSTLRNRQHVHVVRKHIRSDRTIPLVLLDRSQTSEPDSFVGYQPKSLLPESTRVLGRLNALTSTRPENVKIDLRASPFSFVFSADAPTVKTHVDKVVAEVRESIDRSPAGWPVTQQLDQQLLQLSALAKIDLSGSSDHLVSTSAVPAQIVRWSEEVSRRLEALQTLPRLGDPAAGTLIEELSALAAEGRRGAEDMTERKQQAEWLRASYALARRQAVWRSVWDVTNSPEPTWTVGDDSGGGPESIAAAIAAVQADLDETGDANGWKDYLLLDQVRELNEAGQSERRPIMAKRLLTRLTWHGLDPDHSEWLQRDSVKQLAEAIRPWARGAVDYAKLMTLIERQESDAIDLVSVQISDAIQTLRFADNPKAVRVADAIASHYRNANVRVVISKPMLHRMLPTIVAKWVPVRTQMFGSRVRGASRIDSDFEVELNPSADSWSMKLTTTGKVRSESTGVNGPVAVRTSGDSVFVATTPIEFKQRSVQVAPTDITVCGRTELQGIRSGYDRLPLIGSLVRSLAGIRYDTLATRSNEIANQMIETQVASEIDTQVKRQLGDAGERLRAGAINPLRALSLDPRVMEMQTSDDRLVARYRLAGDWQLAAFTPRPRAPVSSLLSMQLHQSAMNNTLEQLLPREESMPIRDVIRHCAGVFGQTDVQLSDEIPEDVSVRFAPTRPITVEIEDGQLMLTMRIVRLTLANRDELTKFIVRATYKPQVDGLRVALVRDGHLRISGPGMSMRERLPARAIFNKVLSPNRLLSLTPDKLLEHQAAENLVVSQLELRGGWIGFAVSEDEVPEIAAGPSPKLNRDRQYRSILVKQPGS
jgi:hypothetical protein